MSIPPFLDWNGNIFDIENQALAVSVRKSTTAGDGFVSTVNSTEANLAGGATFEGTFENVVEYGGIRVSVYSSHASATGGLQMWCSKDGTNGFAEDSYTVPAATPKTYAVPVASPYFKIKYVNGATTTTTLKICVMYQRNVSIPSSHRIGDVITDDDDAQLIKSVLTAKKPNGTFTPIDATAGGNLKVSLEEVEVTGLRDFYVEVAEGNIPTYSIVHKFGASASIGTTLLPIALANNYATPTTATALEFLSSDANDTAAGSGARQITVIGLDANWAEVSQTVTTAGTTPVALSTNLLRLYRWYVSSSGSYATQAVSSHAGTLTIREAGGGTTWGQITITPFPMGQSQIGAYTVPLGKTAYILNTQVYVSSTKAVDILLFQRPNANDVTSPYSGAIRLVSQWAGVTGYLPVNYRTPRGPFVGPCDIGFMGKVSAGTGSATVEFELILENT